MSAMERPGIESPFCVKDASLAGAEERGRGRARDSRSGDRRYGERLSLIELFSRGLRSPSRMIPGKKWKEIEAPILNMTNSTRTVRCCLLSGLLMSLMVFTVGINGQSKATAPAQPAAGGDQPRYKNASLPIEDRVADLLPRMTLEEKVEQITGGWETRFQVIDPTGTYTTEKARQVIANTWGADQKFTPRESAILRNGVQRYQLEKTRLGIPAMFLGEGLHGFMEYGSTSFPQALGLAATWDPALVKRVFTAVGDEAGSRGAGQLFSPVLDLARDPRWGRT